MFRETAAGENRSSRDNRFGRHSGSTSNAGDARHRLNRRAFLGDAAAGIGVTALATLLNPELLRANPVTPDKISDRGVVSPLHYPQRIKRVIFLYMSGGPSQ